jgi:hypothetical protein
MPPLRCGTKCIQKWTTDPGTICAKESLGGRNTRHDSDAQSHLPERVATLQAHNLIGTCVSLHGHLDV